MNTLFFIIINVPQLGQMSCVQAIFYYAVAQPGEMVVIGQALCAVSTGIQYATMCLAALAL